MENNKALIRYNKGLDVFDYYLGKKLRVGQHINSPFRSDSNSASFNLYINKKNGMVYFKDHVSNLFGDAIDFVKYLRGVDYKAAIDIINQDLLHQSCPAPFTHLDNPRLQKMQHSDVLITYQKRDWTRADSLFWYRYCIPSFESAFYVHEKLGLFPAETATIIRPAYSYTFTYQNSDPLYVIDFPSSRRKTYRPLANRKYKWRSTATVDDVFGLWALADELPAVFIMGGNKDTIACTCLLGQFLCIATPSESTHLPPYLCEVLRAKTKNKYLVFDADSAGRKATRSFLEMYPDFEDASAPIVALHQKDATKKDFADLIATYRTNPDAIEKIKHYFFDRIYKI